MKKRILQVIAFAALIGWMTVIFIYSGQTAETSSKESGKVIDKVAEIVVEDYNERTPEEKQEIIIRLQSPVRTVAHFAEYAVLGLLAVLAVLTLPLHPHRRYIYSFVFCVLYSVTDELHQTAIPGRAFQGTDILIDTLGVLAGIAVCFILKAAASLLRRRKANT